MAKSKEELLALMKKVPMNGQKPLEIPFEFTDKEKNLIIAAITEAEIANKELQMAQQTLQQAQINLQQRQEELRVRARVAERTYKTIMVLKNVNPDAYEVSWEGSVEDLQLKIKPVEGKKE